MSKTPPEIDSTVKAVQQQLSDNDIDASTDSGASSGAKTGKEDAAAGDDKTPTLMSEIRFYAIFVLCFVLFSSFGWGHYRIPSESMQPTLEVGDRLYVSKFAYGYSRQDLPFGNKLTFLGDGVFNASYPERGDVVVFRNPYTDMVTIKRVIGLPGDRIEYRAGRILMNGELIERKKVDEFFYREETEDQYVVKVTKYEEQWEGEDAPHYIYERADTYANDNMGEYVVPDGHIFLTGDNRDNSLDSRVGYNAQAPSKSGPGFVPLSRVIGRAEMMVLSFKRCKEEEGLKCPGSRWFQKL